MPDLNRSVLVESENADTLGGLTDVAITAAEEFQGLSYNGTQWVNSHIPVVSYVRNAEANTLTTGTVVYLFGGTGDHATVKRADNSSDATSSKTLGIVANPISASQNGPVVTRGYVDGVDLSVGYSVGDILWLNANGGFTTTKPTSPAHLVFVGVVVRASINGIIYVAIQNGYELNELHDVSISNTLASGDFLKYNGSTWVNGPITLGTDTTGNYMSNVSAGNLISISHTPGEGSTATINVANGTSGQVVVANASGVPTYVTLSGDVTIAANGETTIAANAVALGTDTTGNYVATITGTANEITVTGSGSESAAVTLSLPANVTIANNLTLSGGLIANSSTGSNGLFLKSTGTGVEWAAVGGAATTTSITTNSETTIATFNKTAAKSAEFFVNVNQGNRLYSTKILTLQNETSADFTQYGDLSFSAQEIAETAATIWTTRTSNFESTQINSVAYGNNLWVAGGVYGHLRTSTDAITWVTRNSNFGNTMITFVAYGNNLFVAAGFYGQLRTSTDAITWVTRTSNFGTSSIWPVAYGNNLWIAGGYGALRTSTDAITWVTRNSNFGNTGIRSIAYGNNFWVAGGGYGQLRDSTDGITWTTRTSNFGNTGIRSIAYGNNLWVAGGYYGQLRTSTDAITWVTRTSNFGNTVIRSIAYGNSLWVAVGSYGHLRTSTDAITWVTQTSNFGNTTINSIAYGNNLFVAAGNNGQLRTSDTVEYNYVGGLTSGPSTTFNVDILNSDVRLRMAIPDAATMSATVKVLTTTI